MSIELLALLFILSNILLIPLYGLMVFFPQRGFTQRIMASPWSVAAPSLLTVGVGVAFLLTSQGMLGEFVGLLSSSLGPNSFHVYLQLVTLPPAALVMWLHAIAADVVMARWAYLESRDLGLNLRASSLAIFLMGTNGPLGFLVYLLIRQRHLKKSQLASGA